MLSFICPPAESFFILTSSTLEPTRWCCDVQSLKTNHSAPPGLSLFTLDHHALTMKYFFNCSLFFTAHLFFLLLIELALFIFRLLTPPQASQMPGSSPCNQSSTLFPAGRMYWKAQTGHAMPCHQSHCMKDTSSSWKFPSQACISLWPGFPSASSSGRYCDPISIPCWLWASTCD